MPSAAPAASVAHPLQKVLKTKMAEGGGCGRGVLSISPPSPAQTAFSVFNPVPLSKQPCWVTGNRSPALG